MSGLEDLWDGNIPVGSSSPSSSSPTGKTRQPGYFVKGPIPLDWLQLASRCGKLSISVAVLLWYQHGLQRGQGPIRVTHRLLDHFGIHPRTAKRVLAAMAEANLITVRFRRGASPVVLQIHLLTTTGAQVPNSSQTPT